MADDLVANPGAGGGTFRTLDDGTRQWPASVLAYATTISAGANVLQEVTASFPLPVTATALDIRALTNADVVTAELSATDNAVLDTINTAVVAVQAAVEGTLTVGSHAVTNAGTFAVQATLDAETTKVIGTVNVAAAQTIATTNAGVFVVQEDGAALTALVAIQAAVEGTVTVDLGANNDVTMATLPDTAAGDLAAINAALGGTLTVGSHAVTNAGTFAVQVDGDALTALQLIDDSVFADDAAFTLTSSKLIVGGGIRDDALSALAAVEADVVPFRLDANGALWVINSGTVTVDLGANNDVTMATLPDTAAGDLAAINAALGGTLTVGSHAVTNAGVFAVQIDGDALTALQLIDDPVATISATPVMRVAIFDAGDTQITSFGGTQYDEGDTDASITGTAMLWEDSGNTLATISAANPLPVISQLTQYTEGDTDASISGTAILWEDSGNTLATVRAGNPLPVLLTDAHSEDFDTGGGTDTTAAFGIAVPSGSGAVVIPGDATAGLKVDLGADNDVTLATLPDTSAGDLAAINAAITACDTGAVVISSGTVTTVSTVTNLSQLGGAAVPIGAGLEATAVRVTLPTDGTGIVGLAAGTNAIGKLAANDGVDIGDVDIASIAAGDNNIGNVDIVTQPARDRLTDNVGVALQTDVILNDTTALTPKFAAIAAAGSGDNTLVAAVVGKKVRVHAVYFIAAAAVTARFEDGAGGTALTGQMEIGANGGFVLPFNPAGWFETTANTLLNLELSGAISCAGSLVYTEV